MADTKVRKKVSKTSVNYRKATGKRSCGDCAMYHKVGHYCDLVAGVINDYMLCDKWVKK